MGVSNVNVSQSSFKGDDISFVKSSQMAEILNINKRLLLKLAKEHRIPAVKCGSIWRFNPKEVIASLSD